MPTRPNDPNADTTEPPADTELTVLARRGGNDKVIEKKVLLAQLATEEAVRLGIVLDDAQIQALADQYCRELGLLDTESIMAWLTKAGLTREEFHAAIADFAAVLAVQSHHQERLGRRLELHRRLLSARTRHLTEKSSPR
ncbi:MAG: hypothetical protein LJE91_17310 [Gammaproteobacteria bacterium]|nr:hypothetical protein [Gammaproteobacteria bacterium]